MRKILLAILLTIVFLFPGVAHAEIIHSFNTHISAHKNGDMDITETIEYDFEYGQRHGIFRDIPLYSKVGNLYRIIEIENVQVLRDGKTEKVSVSKDRENINFKIGNPDKTITGNHVYEISYKVKNGIGSNFEDRDEVYWNATGNDWDVVIENAKATVNVQKGINQTDFLCFQGSLGSKDKSCLINENSAEASRPLSIGEGLTVVAVYPPDTFPKSVLSKTPPKTLGDKIFGLIFANILFILFVINIVIPLALIYWYEKHKNKKRFGSPSVNFDLPKDDKGKRIAPAIAGTIDTTKLDKNDVTATIFDLAIRKYIKLSEEKTEKKLIPDKKEQIITKLKELDDSLQPFERELFRRLFRDGDSVKVSDLKSDFYVTFQSMETSVFSFLVNRGYYIKNPKTQKALLLFFGIFTLFWGQLILSATLFFLSRRLNGRTTKGDEIDFRIDGLKLFLKSMDRNYKWQAKNIYTVEQMIPYAVALGYIDEFMAALKILKPDYSPSWYSGRSFYTNYALFSAATSSNFTTSAPSSSSGSGGGGSSGGGGGGGGGGSW